MKRVNLFAGAVIVMGALQLGAPKSAVAFDNQCWICVHTCPSESQMDAACAANNGDGRCPPPAGGCGEPTTSNCFNWENAFPCSGDES